MLYYHCFVNEKGYFFTRRVKGVYVPFDHCYRGVKLITLEDDTPYEQIPSLLRSKFFTENVISSQTPQKIDIVQFIN
jgi:hypothetical protein